MKKLFALVVGVLLLVSSAEARIMRVNNTPGAHAQYTTLENALIDCAAGDTIYLEASSNAYGPGDAYGYDPLRITKPVTIVGQGYFLKENGITNYAVGESFIGSTLKIYSKNVTISSCILTGVEIYNNECTISKCQILAGSNNAVELADSINGGIIRQNFIVGNVQGNGYPQNITVINNIICGNVTQLERSRIERNTFGKYNRFGTIRNLRFCSVIENIIYSTGKKNNQINTCSMSNNFIGDYTKDIEVSAFDLDSNYKVKLDSPLYDKASDGDQLGAYGGALPYVSSGLPDTPVIQSYSAPTEVNQRIGLEVTITYRIER